MRRNCFLQRVIEGKIKGGIEGTGRRGGRRKKLLDDLKEMRGYSHLKEEALERTMWRARFWRGFGSVVRQTIKWMNADFTLHRIFSTRSLVDVRLETRNPFIRKVRISLDNSSSQGDRIHLAMEEYRSRKVSGAMSVHLHNSVSANATFQINLNGILKEEESYVLNWPFSHHVPVLHLLCLSINLKLP